MDEICVEEIVDAILEKQDSCTYREVYDACEKFHKKHKGIYIDSSGDNLDAYLYGNIGDKHRKYPDIEAYEKLMTLMNGQNK